LRVEGLGADDHPVCSYWAFVAARLAYSRPPWKIGSETLGRMEAMRLCQRRIGNTPDR
jgi:hypothetical protein